MIVFAVFLPASSLSSILLLITLTLSLLLHQRYQPYHTPFLNTLEASSHSIQLIFVYVGLIFQQSGRQNTQSLGSDSSNNINSDMINSQLSSFLFVVLLMSNFHFFALWIYNFRLELIKVMLVPG